MTVTSPVVRRSVRFLSLAVLVAGALAPPSEANRRGGVRFRGEIVALRCDGKRPVAVCRVDGRRLLVGLSGAAIFADGAPAACGDLEPGRRFAAYGNVVSREPLALDACLFIQRTADDEVLEVCGDITAIDAVGGRLALTNRERRVIVIVDPGLTRITLQGERATIDDLTVGLRACAVGVLVPGDPAPILRPTLRLQARNAR